MSETDDGPDSLVLRYLRSIRGKLSDCIERIDSLGQRVTALEAVVDRLVAQTATLNNRLDGIERRLERIELELA